MDELVKDYVNKIEELDEFKRLLELKDLINKKYGLLIISFKTKEAKYLEAKERGNIFDLDLAKKEFQEAKTKLYEKEEVKEYFILERKLNSILEDDINELKRSISNKFKEYHSIIIEK